MITSFNDTINEFEHTGNKSYNLARALDLGIKVPPYVCITPSDCINNTINPNTFKRLKRILQINFPEGTLFAVRPSINIYDENLCRQFESYLNVPIDRLDEYIDDCFAYINTKRIQSYIKRRKNIIKFELNVIVQQMVSQDLCGVMFTSNPIGIVSENMIVVGSGDCNDVFENKNQYNNYYYNVPDGKSYWIINSDNHVLKGDTLKSMYSMLEKVKKFYTKPVRLDFSITNNEVYILQLEMLQNFSLDNVITLCGADMMMDYQKDNLPLNVSFIKDYYGSIFSNLIYHLTNSKDFVDNNRSIFKNVISVYNGRPYYNINNLYQVFSMIPFSSETDNLPNDEISLLNRILNNLSMIKALITSTQKLETVQQNFQRVEKIFKDCFSEELSDIQLKTLYRVILNKTIEKWDINVINSVYCHINDSIHRKSASREDTQPILDINIENGMAGLMQQQILLGLSGNDIPTDILLKLYNYIQKIFVAMGKNFVRLGYIENQKDVYYLTIKELFNSQIRSYKEIVAQRKLANNFYNKLPIYNQVSFDGRIINKSVIKDGIII